MTTGTGLFLLGVWAAVGCAYAAPSTTSIGVRNVTRAAYLCTIAALALTAAMQWL